MEWKTLSEKQQTIKFAADPQRGEVYELETEAAWDILFYRHKGSTFADV
jgi:hypothetical protein